MEGDQKAMEQKQHHTPQRHQQCNCSINCGHNPSLHRSNKNMCMGPPNMRPQLSNTPCNNSLIFQRVQQQQQQQRANSTTNANANANGVNNNIHNVNHIQNKYNTTIINLNGESVPRNNGLLTNNNSNYAFTYGMYYTNFRLVNYVSVFISHRISIQ